MTFPDGLRTDTLLGSVNEVTQLPRTEDSSVNTPQQRTGLLVLTLIISRCCRGTQEAI